MSLVQPNQTYTYQDYVQWNDDQRWELIDGVPHNMSPAPNTSHQRLVSRLTSFFNQKLNGKKCEVFPLPTDVILSDYDVVQPDVLVVCSPEKVKEKGIFGAPDLVIEIVSPSSSRRDRWDKKALYEKYGVKEYLQFDPDAKYAEQYVLDKNGKYSSGDAFADKDSISLQSLDGLELRLQEIFVEVISDGMKNTNT